MIRKQKIRMQFLNINTIFMVILLSIFTTSVAYASNENINTKMQEVRKELNDSKKIINMEQLEKKNIKINKFYDNLVIQEKKVKMWSNINYKVSTDTVKTKKINGYKNNSEVKQLTRDTEKKLSDKVKGITPKVEKMSTTAYCACTKCCDKADAITASGEKALEWYTVASGNCYKFGTIIYIPALSDKPNGGWFMVQDRGAAISHNRLDVFFNDHEIANLFGINEFEVYVYEF